MFWLAKQIVTSCSDLITTKSITGVRQYYLSIMKMGVEWGGDGVRLRRQHGRWKMKGTGKREAYKVG